MFSFRCLTTVFNCSKTNRSSNLRPQSRLTATSDEPNKRSQTNIEFPLSTYIDEMGTSPKMQNKEWMAKTTDDELGLISRSNSSSKQSNNVDDIPVALIPIPDDEHLDEHIQIE